MIFCAAEEFLLSQMRLVCGIFGRDVSWFVCPPVPGIREREKFLFGMSAADWTLNAHPALDARLGAYSFRPERYFFVRDFNDAGLLRRLADRMKTL